MADSSPLLPPFLLAEPETSDVDEPQASLDSVVERVIGDFGWTQLVQSTLVLLSRFFDAQQTFISVYADSEPAWHCINNGICNSSADICDLSKSSWPGMDTLTRQSYRIAMLTGFNIYLSVAFNALAEIPSYIIFSFIVSKWSRKGSLLAFTTLGGICSIMCIMNWKEVVLIGLELVSYLSACTAFIMLMIYTLELFPTRVRNGASSMVRQAPVFGAVFSPILISAGRSNKVLSYGLFGLVILCSSVFVFCLPETRGVALSDTMDEQEEKEQLAM